MKLIHFRKIDDMDMKDTRRLPNLMPQFKGKAKEKTRNGYCGQLSDKVYKKVVA